MRFQSGKSKLTLKAILSVDRDDCCAETWKLVIGGSWNANSGGYSLELEAYATTSWWKLNFDDTWGRAGQRQ